MTDKRIFLEGLEKEEKPKILSLLRGLQDVAPSDACIRFTGGDLSSLSVLSTSARFEVQGERIGTMEEIAQDLCSIVQGQILNWKQSRDL